MKYINQIRSGSGVSIAPASKEAKTRIQFVGCSRPL